MSAFGGTSKRRKKVSLSAYLFAWLGLEKREEKEASRKKGKKKRKHLTTPWMYSI